jgi:hypothetical protein
MARRKPIPPLNSDDSEPLFASRNSGDDATRFTLQDHPTPTAPEFNRYSLHDPSFSQEFSALHYSGMVGFSEEDRTVLSPISERPERQSSKASSSARSGSTVVGGSVHSASVFSPVMQNMEAPYHPPPDWSQATDYQQQQQPPPPPQAYSTGHHGMLFGLALRPQFTYQCVNQVSPPAAPSFASQPTGITPHTTGFTQYYHPTGTDQSYQHTGTMQSYQDTGPAQSYQHTGFTQPYQHTGASYPQQPQSTGFNYSQPT